MFPDGRRMLCVTCEHHRQCGAWTWAKCYFAHSEVDDPADVPDLTPERYEAREPTCPSGRWQEHDEPGSTWAFPMRRQVCAECEHGRERMVCDSPECVIDGKVITRDGAFMHGPESNCPLGKFAGLQEFPVVRSREQREELRADAQVRQMGAFLRLILADLPDFDDRLERLVTDPHVRLDPEAAARISEGDIE